MKEDMNIVIVGHVDHGKSTVIGRLLFDTDVLPHGKIESVKNECERTSKPFEYAFLLDALSDEQNQGITIDSARVFFETDKRKYIIIDAPGHIEFLKNMITGASRAEAALLVIDADEGIKENSRRHGYMLSLLGIKQIAVLINKMDLIDYDEQRYNEIVSEYGEFLKSINVSAEHYVPLSAINGDNVVGLSEKMPWYKGRSVLECLDLFPKKTLDYKKPFRMYVQDVYKFTRFGDKRRIIAGTIDSGTLKEGDNLVFYPSGKRSTVKSIEGFNRENLTSVTAGFAAGFTLTEQIYLSRGELASKEEESPPLVSQKIKASIFWIGKNPLIYNKEYILKIGTERVSIRLDKIENVINSSDLKNENDLSRVNPKDAAVCVFKMNRPIAFDVESENSYPSRFVIVDGYDIAGGGLVLESVVDELSEIRNRVMVRNYKWEKSAILPLRRAEKYNQKPTLILLTGKKDAGKKPLARALEKELFEEGKFVYFLGIGNVLYGVDADIKGHFNSLENREHLRRLSEIAYIMLDAGNILIVTAVSLSQQDLEIIKTVVYPDNILVVWVGDSVETDISYDLHLRSAFDIEKGVEIIKEDLCDKGIIFRPW